MQDIESRLLALEKANRLYRRLLGVAVVCAAAMAVGGAGQGVPDKVQAKTFEVLDDSGTVIASMSHYKGNGAVSTFNAQGKLLTDIVATAGGAGGVVTYDGAGHQNMKLTDVTGGGGSIVINNASQQSVIELGHNTQAAGSILLRNKTGKTILQNTSDTADTGAVLTYDADGNQTARMPGSK
jgi:hypothetical protein